MECRKWAARMNSWVAPLQLERIFLGRHKFLHYRVWYRDALAGYVQQILLDPRTLSRPFLERRNVEAMVKGHVRGNRNSTTAIHKLLMDGTDVPAVLRRTVERRFGGGVERCYAGCLMQKTQDRRGGEEAVSREPSAADRRLSANAATSHAPLEIALLTGGQDRHYAIGLAMALVERDVAIEVIGSDEIDGPELHGNPRAQFRNLHGGQQSAGLAQRIGRILSFYARLFRYASTARPKIFHILWNNKLQVLDRTFVMLFYKLAGKKVVFTAHNVNAGRRDKKDTWLNRVTLKCQYKLLDHLFVHTEKMKSELVSEFGVSSAKITIIPYGINNAVPCTELTREEARQMLGLRNDEKTILFFGAIKQYKGLEYLVAAFQQIAARDDYRLIIAGERKKGYEKYWQSIEVTIESHPAGIRSCRRLSSFRMRKRRSISRRRMLPYCPIPKSFRAEFSSWRTHLACQ